MGRLYHLPLSPFCRKVRLLLAEKKLEISLIEEPVWKRQSDFIKQSPSSKVPLLKMDGLTISESNTIFEYLEEVYPTPPLLPKIMADRVEARRFAGWFDDTFHNDVTSKLLYQRVYLKLSGGNQVDSVIMKCGLAALKIHFDYVPCS